MLVTTTAVKLQIVITATAVLPHHIYCHHGITVKFSPFPHSNGNYCGYRSITVLPITMSTSHLHAMLQLIVVRG